jgi:cytochrome c biogenesis protein CcdA
MPPTDPAPETYRLGMVGVISAFFLLFALLAAVDLIFEWKRAPSISFRLESWSRLNPWFAGALLLVLGALLAHFVLNPWPPLPAPIRQ